MKRIQRKRTKGWRMPPNTVYVGRGSKWGNPFKLGVDGTREQCLKKYAGWLMSQWKLTSSLNELRGKDLACWCKLTESCHADILIEEAGAEKN